MRSHHAKRIGSSIGIRLYQRAPKSGSRKDSNLKAPVANKEVYTRSKHGITWDDPYHWMSNARDPSVRRHLELENLYTDTIMGSTSALQAELREEMASRIVGDESSPPERWGSWLYYAKIPEGQDYPVYLRRHVDAGSVTWLQRLKSNVGRFFQVEQCNLVEQKLLDMNELVEGHGFVHLGVCKVSKDHRLLAYTLDFFGREVFTLFVKDIQTGALISKPIAKGVVSVEWARDSCSLLYTKMDKMLRPFRVFKHNLKSKGGNILVYEEKNPQFFIDVSKTKDWCFFTINSNSKTSSEVYLLDANGHNEEIKLVEHRRPGVEYFVEHQDGQLFLLTNADMSHRQGSGSNYKLFNCPINDLRFDNWKHIVLEEPDVVIYDMDIFERHLVLFERKDGLPQIRVLKLPISVDMMQRVCSDVLPLPKGVCSITPGLNQDYSSSVLRLSISSPIMPEALLDCDLSSKEFAVLQQNEVVCSLIHKAKEKRLKTEISSEQDHDAPNVCRSQACDSTENEVLDLSEMYALEHVKVASHDMVEVPLTIVYSRDLKMEGKSPALLTGYGAYGESLDMKWCADSLSLLDRGWVLAFAHVRGGGELGKAWHDSGRLLKKLNSMHDFLACGEFLVKRGFCHRDFLTARGVSAGGLLVAASIHMQAALFLAVILKVHLHLPDTIHYSKLDKLHDETCR
ncbi:hypothetical protein KP509_02G092500 [Ceratopteris richardii]|uniref:Prolyl endopeptidase n=1 Tax=Ceratopteris richardii TaxID=49495 RepID=A0A8T2VC79_CERRI|nr:hypothetical protein KP509_02G092500 [Ceratopteris richardii]